MGKLPQININEELEFHPNKKGFVGEARVFQVWSWGGSLKEVQRCGLLFDR